jgi:tripartite-type tricarboxylate transporter receptor subunit TctC
VLAANAINATLHQKLKFSPVRDLAMVAGMVRVTNVMEIKPAVPANTVPEFIAYAKANPGKLSYASGHLADAAQTPDAATLARIHTSLADAVKEILAAFPNSVHPGSPNLAEEQQEERPATTGSAR